MELKAYPAAKLRREYNSRTRQNMNEYRGINPRSIFFLVSLIQFTVHVDGAGKVATQRPGTGKPKVIPKIRSMPRRKVGSGNKRLSLGRKPRTSNRVRRHPNLLARVLFYTDYISRKAFGLHDEELYKIYREDWDVLIELNKLLKGRIITYDLAMYFGDGDKSSALGNINTILRRIAMAIGDMYGRDNITDLEDIKQINSSHFVQKSPAKMDNVTRTLRIAVAQIPEEFLKTFDIVFKSLVCKKLGGQLCKIVGAREQDSKQQLEV